jgi:HAD superfamily hydrolase (TIGR01509 family)
MNFDAIIFDFDGVIVDSESVANAALAEVLTAQGFPVTRDEALSRYAGLRWTDCHSLIEQDSGLGLDAETLGDMVDRAISERVADVLAIEGLEPFLAKQGNRKLAIASSSETAWLQSSLDRLGLAGYFEGRLYSAAGFARGKPHPDIYLHAAAELGVAPERCLVIEDHPVGVAAGAAAGMTVIALLAGSHIRAGHDQVVAAAGAHHVARDYGQISEIIGELERQE